MTMVETGSAEKLTPEEIAAEFGWAASFLDHPELGPLLREAAAKGFTELQFKTKLFKTKFWKKITDASGAWENLRGQKPAEAERRIEVQKQTLRQIASEFNGALSEIQLEEIAERVLRYGWQGQEVISAVASELLRGSDAQNILRTGITGRSIQQIANQFAIPISDFALDEWSERIATGRAMVEDFTNYARTQAKSLFPSLAADIDRGSTVAALADPYKQFASRLLGVNPAEIDFSQPKWNVALNFADDKGRRMMTLNEWGQYLRTNEEYGYQYTDDAKNKAYSAANTIARLFGRV
jgi:hypothetical protein